MANMSNYPMIKMLRNMGENIKIDSETNLSELMGALETANSNIGTVANDISTIKSNVNAVKSNVSTIKTDVGAVNTNVSTVKTNLATVDNIVDVINSNLAGIKVDGLPSVKSVQRGQIATTTITHDVTGVSSVGFDYAWGKPREIIINTVNPSKSIVLCSFLYTHSTDATYFDAVAMKLSIDGDKVLQLPSKVSVGSNQLKNTFYPAVWQVIEFY